ncbi:SGNH/GDSL hydrolase family protein [Anaerofustis stercorihominis]|uniref:SGNH/GDSL hydrolase family protein n=1 Tax=Anaerofustis stercorihominis TaxID=214853 RepID=A0A3E3DYL0_9FIRM|nr:SGNH/GDSL hydrolase family protein [Anaerofustis stercorihominis]RGD74381.1 SGNH/GDSL hydrolase family protein [Anaerofustis stercorihominis]
MQKKYYIYSGYNDKNGNRHWQKVSTVNNKSSIRQKTTINVNPKHYYFTVKAVSIKNNKTIYSPYDKKFCVNNRKYDNKSILYIGDSITFGSPYKSVATREIFSYPWRVHQLTNVKYYNPSIPGATYAYKDYNGKGYFRHRLITDVAEKINNSTTPVDALHSNTKTYKDFDVVVMAAGTNDYSDNIKLGDKDSTNIKEFNGAINTIISYIENANIQRREEGKKPIKIVFTDLYYSNRTDNYSELINRFKTKNKIGLTLTDYQNDINNLIDNYKSKGLDVYQFHTKNIVTEESCPYKTSDNLHMTRTTYSEIGNKLSKFLIDEKII